MNSDSNFSDADLYLSTAISLFVIALVIKDARRFL